VYLTSTSLRVYLGGATGSVSASSHAVETSQAHPAAAGDFAGVSTVGWTASVESYSSSRGAVYVHTGVSTNAVTTIVGDRSSDYAGTDIAGGGDVNGDGVADLWIGARGDDQYNTSDGTAALFLGPLTGSHTMADHDGRVAGGGYFDTLGEHVWMGATSTATVATISSPRPRGTTTAPTPTRAPPGCSPSCPEARSSASTPSPPR